MGRKKNDADEARENSKPVPDIEATLVMMSYAKKRGTETQPGYSLKFTAPLVATEVSQDDEAEIKKPAHGMLTICSRNLFDGPRTVTLTGKLKRRFVAAKGDNPAFQVWALRLGNRPTKEARELLVELSEADGDDVLAAVEAEFFIKAEEPKPVQVSDGPELFTEADEEIARIKGQADPLGQDNAA